MIVGTNYYSWQPNPVMIKDPETKERLGNVLGDVSKAEQTALVSKAGELYSLEIRETSEMYKRVLGPEANRSFLLVDSILEICGTVQEYYDLPEPEPDLGEEEEPDNYILWEADPNLTGVPSMGGNDEPGSPAEEEPAEDPQTVEVEGTYYSWAAVVASVKDPETKERLGNVFGDVSKQEQVALIRRVGTELKSTIQQDSERYKNMISPGVLKRIEMTRLMESIFDSIADYYDYEEETTVFVLDSSTLGNGILG